MTPDRRKPKPRPSPSLRRPTAQPGRMRRPTPPPAGHADLPAEFTDASRGVRLQRVMAQAGVAARRDCEQLILDGRVQVNGLRVAALPAWVDPMHDAVTVDGRLVSGPRKSGKPSAGGTPEGRIVVVLNKPRRVISTTDDEHGRKSVMDLLPPELVQRHRLFPVGRLDAESTGLMLLTDDGQLANHLTHPRYEVAKQYRVAVRGWLSEEDIIKLREGLFLAHKRTHKTKRAAMAEVELLNHQRDETRGDRTNLLVTLREGQNREIRRMLARLGYKVRRLQRLAIGPITLKGLPVGGFRVLTKPEVNKLRHAGA